MGKLSCFADRKAKIAKKRERYLLKKKEDHFFYTTFIYFRVCLVLLPLLNSTTAIMVAIQVLSLAFLATVTNAEITHQLPLRPKHGHGPKGPYGPPHPHPTPLGPYRPLKHYGVKPKPYTPAPYHAPTP